MVSFLRRVGRGCSAVIAVHVTMVGSLFLFSRFGTDRLSEAHWRYSTPVLLKPVTYVRFWDPAFWQKSLSKEERKCFEAWLDTMALNTPDVGSIEISPQVLVHDSLCVLDGICELRDGTFWLDHLVHSINPYPREIRRECVDRTVFLHAKIRSDIELRVPFTSYVFSCGSFPSSVTLRLESVSTSSHQLAIAAAEHRWFDGPVWSTQTGTVRSPFGDVGDLCRRYNGFMLATMMTKKAVASKKILAIRERAAAIEARVKAEQEKQLSA